MAIMITAVVITAVTGVAVVKAVAVIIPGKDSEKNPEKSSPRKKKGFPSGLLTQKKA